MLPAAARQGDQRPNQRTQRAEQPQDFLALAAVRKNKHGVVGMDHAEIAVNGASGVEKIGAGAGRVKSAGDFETHVGGFAGAGNGDTTRTFGADGQEYIDGLKKRIVEAVGDKFERGRFGTEDLAGVVEPPIRPARRIRQ